MIQIFNVKTSAREELVDITEKVRSIVSSSKIESGLCVVYTPHTTAAVTINENADPDVVTDILKGLRHLNFESLAFRHSEGNSPSHLKSSIIGCSETIIIDKGSLLLGTWQGIYFCEFDGPRDRKAIVKII